MSNPNEELTLAAGWGQVKPHHVLDLPSGSKVLVKELEIQDLLKMGILDLVDSFSQEILPKNTPKGGSAEKQFLQDLAENSGQFEKMVDVMNQIAASAVAKPPVTYVAPPKPGTPAEDLDPDKIYAHLIPLEDRIAIFEKAVVGMEDLFRPGEGQAEGVADMANVQGVPENSGGAHRSVASHPSLLSE
ncbi:tail assembly chaperone [Gordonia phage Terapin]|uniref:Tail assembly chaperone n=5 Tax=Terapinvirus terapin TaxID=2734283 RepID=A0A345MB60_9CAUD|nr:tail assembly chaperone [Gordonia phage Terapin]AVP43297.1 tail assembly chaperone [Gordonia phage Djokovic]AXH67731.1 tail assembly chaperone [Gordonia phage Beyoncage]QOC56165.1 tail assembly chaperone [Gordonia phage Sienna]QOC56590.1 tail assembly chaperone [Gordonia phage BiteSize]QYW00823.1 tail assembly chaperone [Gordonia phage Madi]